MLSGDHVVDREGETVSGLGQYSQTPPDRRRTRRRSTPAYSGVSYTHSCQDRLDDLAMNVGQPEVAALEAIGQPGVLDPEEMRIVALRS